MAAAVAECLDWLDWAAAGQSLEGSEYSGDLHLVVPHRGGALVGVADGLGHGPEAADAARMAAQVCQRHPDTPLTELMKLCHEALRRTRGAALSLASFEPASCTVGWLGVGNVEGVLIHAADAGDGPEPSAGQGKTEYQSLRLYAGVVGYRIPKLRPTILHVCDGDVLIVATDGIRSGFGRIDPDMSGCQELADKILSEHNRGSDDALVLVARYLGGK